jgi:glutamate-ammonia-ligase adenylyltransferase
MSPSLEKRLHDALSDTVLAERLAICGAPFLENRSQDAAASAIDGPMLIGLARLLASQPRSAGFLSHRPEFFERLATSDASSLPMRSAELAGRELVTDPEDLEGCLDELRLLRREETCFAACSDFGGGCGGFGEVSGFLSSLAESITRQALGLAHRAWSREGSEPEFAVIGMGKIAGREFTYHSDLDLIFLYRGGAEQIADMSRIGQRLIAYLSTTTGAGVAYAVDTRLRPSGQQGMLVTSFEGFERYQCETAETWEHLALLRSRAIAGAIAPAQVLLDRVRAHVVGDGFNAWPALAEMRDRVALERADEDEANIPIKTGLGGSMDLDFLAGGGVFERGATALPELPSTSAMLAASCNSDGLEALLDAHRTLRLVEARNRWVQSRAAESLATTGESLPVIAELFETGTTGPELLTRVADVRQLVRDRYDRVIEQGTIDAV